MQSTPLSRLPVSPSSLAAAFARCPTRAARSVRFPLAAILSLAVAAILANHTSVLAIAEWGRRQSQALLAELGLPTTGAPWQSTLQRLFRRLDGDALAARLGRGFGGPRPRRAARGAGRGHRRQGAARAAPLRRPAAPASMP